MAAILNFLNHNSAGMTALATICMAIFTLALVGANIVLFMQTKKAANAARESAEALPKSERAYMLIEKAIFARSEEGHTKGRLCASVKFKNCGKTPAIITTINTRFVKKGEDIPKPEPHIEGWNTYQPVSASAHWHPPGPVSDENEERFYRGFVKYLDIFGESHTTWFCYDVVLGDLTFPYGGQELNGYD